MIETFQTNSRLKLYNFSSPEKKRMVRGIPTTYQKFVFCQSMVVPCIELSDEEMIFLAEKSETFSFLDKPEEDIYNLNDGEPIK